MTLRDYVLIVARSWIVIVVTVAIGLVTAGILAMTATTKYTSSAQVLFTGHASSSGQDLAYVGNYVQARMQTYKNLGMSNSILEPVVKAIGSGETAQELAGRTEVEVSQLNTIARVTATDTTAKGAAHTANTLAGALLDAVERLEADDAGSAEPANTSVEGVISSKAVVPASPSDPDVVFYLLAGALAGLAVSVVVVALREVLRGEASSSPPAEEP